MTGGVRQSVGVGFQAGIACRGLVCFFTLETGGTLSALRSSRVSHQWRPRPFPPPAGGGRRAWYRGKPSGRIWYWAPTQPPCRSAPWTEASGQQASGAPQACAGTPSPADVTGSQPPPTLWAAMGQRLRSGCWEAHHGTPARVANLRMSFGTRDDLPRAATAKAGHTRVLVRRGCPVRGRSRPRLVGCQCGFGLTPCCTLSSCCPPPPLRCRGRWVLAVAGETADADNNSSRARGPGTSSVAFCRAPPASRNCHRWAEHPWRLHLFTRTWLRFDGSGGCGRACATPPWASSGGGGGSVQVTAPGWGSCQLGHLGATPCLVGGVQAPGSARGGSPLVLPPPDRARPRGPSRHSPHPLSSRHLRSGRSNPVRSAACPPVGLWRGTPGAGALPEWGASHSVCGCACNRVCSPTPPELERPPASHKGRHTHQAVASPWADTPFPLPHPHPRPFPSPTGALYLPPRLLTPTTVRPRGLITSDVGCSHPHCPGPWPRQRPPPPPS